MPAFTLPMLDGHVPEIDGESEQLRAFLAPFGDRNIAMRIGNETIIGSEGALMITQGERYPHRVGLTQGMRYLWLGDHGHPIAALNLTRIRQGQGTQTIASNIYVDPAHRRRGLASLLLGRAQQDYPSLQADSSLTELGAALLGHSNPPVKEINFKRPSP